MAVEYFIGCTEDLWVSRQEILGDGVLELLGLAEEFTESTTEIDVLLGRKMLIAEDEYTVVIAQGLAKVVEGFFGDRSRDVEISDFDAEGRGERG